MNGPGIPTGNDEFLAPHPNASPAGSGQSLAGDDEIRELIRSDPSRTGDVFRGLEAGLTAPQIAELHNVSTYGFVYNYQTRIEAALGDRVPSSRSLLAESAGAIRTLIKRGRGVLSADALALLQGRLTLIEERIRDLGEPGDALASELADQKVDEATLEFADLPGIYAFSYGWYIEHPTESGNFLIKVGRASSVGRRIAEFRSGVRTHMPEPLALLRVYTTASLNLERAEGLFHRLLSTAGHENPRRQLVSRRREVGTEWFLTNEDFLDACAEACGLTTVFIGGSEFAE